MGQGLLVIEVSRTDTSQSVGPLCRVISPTPRPLPNNTQHFRTEASNPPAELESTIRATEQPQTHALDNNMKKVSLTSPFHADTRLENNKVAISIITIIIRHELGLDRPVSALPNKSLQRSSKSTSSNWSIIQHYLWHPAFVKSGYISQPI